MNEHSIIRDSLAMAVAGALDPLEQKRIEEHLRHCETCSAEFNHWNSLVGALKKLPTPQARPQMVMQTRRILELYAAAGNAFFRTRLVPSALILFSWIAMLITWRLVRLIDLPLARRLDISSTIVWLVFIGVTWLATALAAGLLVKHSRQEGKTV